MTHFNSRGQKGPNMEIDHKVENGIINIAIKGRLDAATSPTAEETIQQAIAGDENRLLFDLSGLEYLSSGGLRVILGAAKEMRRREGKIALCSLNSYVNEIFEISGFSAMIPIKDSVEDGLEHLS